MEKEMPKVSIIMPVYNLGKYLRGCLDSVVNQTLTNIEIICVNDCSTDNSLSILKEYANKDNRIQIIEQEFNQGAGIARNVALKIAKGEYIGFVDGDDTIDLNFYETLYNKAKEEDYDIVKGNFNIVNNDKVQFTNENKMIANEIKKTKIPYTTFCTSWLSAIYKKRIIDNYNIEFAPIRHLEDVPFLYKVISVANSFVLLNNVYYHYLIHNNSTSHTQLSYEDTLKKYDDFFSSRKNTLDFYNRIDLPKDKYLLLVYSKVYIGSLYRLRSICANNDIQDYRPYFERIKIMLSKCKYSLDKYKQSDPYLKYFSNNDYYGFINKYIKEVENKPLWYENVFSVKNQYSKGKKHKVITILGIKIKIKCKNKPEILAHVESNPPNGV